MNAKGNMGMISEADRQWLHTKLGSHVDTQTKFNVKFGALTEKGPMDIDVALDLIWFVLVQAEDTSQNKLQIALKLLQDPKLLEDFKSTLNENNPALKRLLSEFLVFNYVYLEGLKNYIDFTKLNAPTDFISHILFIKFAPNLDMKQVNNERLKMVSLILDTGFTLPDSNTPHAVGAALRKVLLIDNHPDNFKIALRMLKAGYKLFNQDKQNDAEIAVLLINNRINSDCLAILQHVKDYLPQIQLPIAGNKSGGNLTDYYYWVKEDMEAVNFVKNTLGIQSSL